MDMRDRLIETKSGAVSLGGAVYSYKAGVLPPTATAASDEISVPRDFSSS